MARTRLFFLCTVLIGLAGGGATLRGQAGGFAYVANCGSTCGGVGPGDVSAYTIDGTTGALTPVADSPFPAGSSPRSVTVGPTGQFVCVANRFFSAISAFTIDGTTGALTEIPGSPFPAGTFPASVTVDPTGRFSYVANEGGLDPGSVSAYTIDGTTGALTPVAGSPFPAGHFPRSVAVDPTGRFAYVANAGDGISAYTIDRATGALVPVAGSPFPAGSIPRSVTTTAAPPPPPAP